MDKALSIPLTVFGMGIIISMFVVLLIKAIFFTLKLFSKDGKK